MNIIIIAIATTKSKIVKDRAKLDAYCNHEPGYEFMAIHYN